MAIIQGIDFSHWQGKFTHEQARKMWEMGVVYAWGKVSQGTNIADDVFRANAELLQEENILVGPYHFATDENSEAQLAWFKKCAGNFEPDFYAMVDCEAYKISNGTAYAIMELRQQKPTLRAMMSLQAGMYRYPSQKCAEYLIDGMNDLYGFETAIYTNKYSGDMIFSSASFAAVPLVVANYGVKSPNLPKVWERDKKWLSWQDQIMPIGSYGLKTGIDHQVWGNRFHLPQPEEKEQEEQVEIKIGSKKWYGKIRKQA